MAGDISQFDPHQKAAVLFDPLFAKNRLVMFAENEHPDPVNMATYRAVIEAMAKRLEELRKTDPNARAAFFCELPPDKGDAQKLINAFSRSGNIKDLSPYYDDPQKQEFVQLLALAQRAGISVFLVDDEGARQQLAAAKGRYDGYRQKIDNFRTEAAEFMQKNTPPAGATAAQLAESKQKQIAWLAGFNTIVAEAKQATEAYATLAEGTLPLRNGTMARRISTIMDGTNTEAYYKDTIPAGGFAFAASQNGSTHLSERADMNELVAQRMGHGSEVCTVELNSLARTPDTSPVRTGLEGYTLRLPSGKIGVSSSDAPDISLNLTKATQWLLEQKEKPASAPQPQPFPESLRPSPTPAGASHSATPAIPGTR